MAVFAVLVALNVKRLLRYPQGLLLSLAIDPIVLLLNIAVFTTIYHHSGRPLILGYGLPQMIWYFAATTFVWYWIFNFADRRIADRIVRGDLTQDLLRPVSVFAWELGFAVALRLGGILLEFIPSLILYRLIVPAHFLTPTALLRFVLAATIAFLLFFHLNFLIGLLGFALQNPRSILAIKHILIAMAAGAFIPLEFFPGAVHRTLNWLPFPHLFYWPIQAFLARGDMATWDGFVKHEVGAVAWLLVLAVASVAGWRRTVRRHTDAGG
jgi:ABC-2 type transport system permease protein